MSVISAAKFRDQLDRWGVDFVEHTRHDRCLNRTVDWSDHEARRGRDCARRGWDAHGIAIHHSGGPTSWQFVWDGRSDVPGPLYTVLIYPDGIAHLTGWRITNNVGSCDDAVRNRVLAGNMPTSGGNVSPGGDDYFAANSEFYGISYRGTAPNAAQRKTALLICAAICSAHGPQWDGGSVAGHKELTRRKPDPQGENMSTFRSDLNKLLAVGPGGTATPKPPEDDMTPAQAEMLKDLHVALVNGNAAQVKSPESDNIASARYGVQRTWLHSWRTRQGVQALTRLVTDHIAESGQVDPEALFEGVQRSVEDGIAAGVADEIPTIVAAVLAALGDAASDITQDAVVDAVKQALREGVADA